MAEPTNQTLTPTERDEVENWAMAFTSRNPGNGHIPRSLLAKPIPVSRQAAFDCARDYFREKLHWAQVRQHYNPKERDVAYWQAVLQHLHQIEVRSGSL
jgi:hypothetical protein